MTKFRSKFQTLLALLFLTLFLTSCDPGCVESYQFDSENRYLNSYPTDDGVFGSYDNRTGGEIAAWHSTDIRTDGKEMVFEIRGAWTAWDEAYNATQLNELVECNICAKKEGFNNCICFSEQSPVPEKDSLGDAKNVDCSLASNQDNPNLCSCTTKHGTTNDFGTYFIATNYQNKDETLKVPDEREACKFTRGAGLYVGLFGRDGNTIPLRVYHVFPTQEICDITRNSKGKCIDSEGNDQTKYIYRSPNKKVFIKDDKSGNNGTDADPNDDEFHASGELVKFIINDRYYRDNYGGYDISFMGGFLKQDDDGLLEYIVGTVEDLILGKVSADGSKRNGGAIEFMYNSIVKDSVFIRAVQLCLIMYITIFGIGVLSGTLEISKKEMMQRILRIGLIILFTTQTSWYIYNQLVVGLFKDGMDAVISVFMSASDKLVDPTSLIFNAQMGRENSLSYATRFAYVDLIIKKLLSAATAKKTLSLVFGEWLGIIYLPATYALIFAFIYVMLTAALAYIRILLGLVFALAMGPIFMVTILFKNTENIFKRWISYMASQSMQIICLFLVIYLFVVSIDKDFTDLLSYRACVRDVDFKLFTIKFLLSETNRDIITWVSMFVKIGALLFLLKMIMEKIPGFVGHMVSVGGQAADNSPSFVSETNASAFGLAGDLLGKARSGIGTAAKHSFGVGKIAARFVGSKTGITDAYKSIRSVAYSAAQKAQLTKAPIVGGLFVRKEDKIIKEQQKKFGTGKDADAKIRQAVIAESRKLGMRDQEVLQRLDQKLVIDPLKKVIKDEAKKMKKEQGANMPLDRKAVNDALTARVQDWAKQNSSVDSSKFTDLLERGNFKSLMQQEGALTSLEAARLFAGDEAAKNKYLEHLQQEQVNKQLKSDEARSKDNKRSWHQAPYQAPADIMGRAARRVQGKAVYNPEDARVRFLSNVKAEEQDRNRQKGNWFEEKARGVSKAFDQSAVKRIGARGHRDELFADARKAQKDTIEKSFKGGVPRDPEGTYKKANILAKQYEDIMKKEADETIRKEMEAKLEAMRKQINDAPPAPSTPPLDAAPALDQNAPAPAPDAGVLGGVGGNIDAGLGGGNINAGIGGGDLSAVLGGGDPNAPNAPKVAEVKDKAGLQAKKGELEATLKTLEDRKAELESKPKGKLSEQEAKELAAMDIIINQQKGDIAKAEESIKQIDEAK